jgi:hypothetical protein
MNSLFGQRHPWLMQALGGLIAFVIFAVIAAYFYINVVSTETIKAISPLAPPASPGSSLGSGGGQTGGSGGTGGSSASPTASTGGSTSTGKVTWADVHAIFAQRCVGCHVGAKLGGLSLDTYAGAMKGGSTAAGGPVNGAVIKPGDAANSYLYQVITGKQQPRMPLGGAPLSAAQIKTIHDWIQSGAKA